MKKAASQKRGEIAVFGSARPDANVAMDKQRLPVQNSCRERSRMDRMNQVAFYLLLFMHWKLLPLAM
jgi:hypothetical protein